MNLRNLDILHVLLEENHVSVKLKDSWICKNAYKQTAGILEKVFFSDESKFNIQRPDKQKLVWRKKRCFK